MAWRSVAPTLAPAVQAADPPRARGPLPCHTRRVALGTIAALLIAAGAQRPAFAELAEAYAVEEVASATEQEEAAPAPEPEPFFKMFQSKEKNGYSFEYPRTWKQIFDESAGNPMGQQVLLSDEGGMDTVTVTKVDVTGAALVPDARGLAEYLTQGFRDDATTVQFDVVTGNEVDEEPGRFTFEFEMSTCKGGWVEEDLDGVRFCGGAGDQPIKTLDRHYVGATVLGLESGEAWVLTAGTTEERFPEMKGLLKEIVASFYVPQEWDLDIPVY